MVSHGSGADLTVRSCNELIEAAQNSGSVEELHSLCGHLCERAGFDYFLYGAILPVSLTRPETFIVSGYPADWWSRYQEQGYFGIDPVVDHTTSHQTVPLDWHEIDANRYARAEQVRNFFGEAADFGLVSGISFPVQGQNGECAVLSLATRDEHSQAHQRIIETMPFAQLITCYVHEAARGILSRDPVTMRRPSLTQREQECLLWAAEGKTSWDTAKILQISERTVLFHLRNAADKLNVSNRAQAVARAVVMGYITQQFD